MMLRVPWDRSGRWLAGRTEPRAQATGPGHRPGAPGRLRLGLWAALAALIGLSDFPATAQEHSPTWLEPTWTCRIEAGIEWAEAVGRGDASAVLVATPAGQLHLIDLRTGKPRLAEPLRASRGVRPVEGQKTADAAYCFDRHAACAIRLAEPAGLKWRYGETRGGDEEFQGDPETLTGWSLAAVTKAGLLLVNVDGRVVLLSADDGQVRWELRLGLLPVSRLHVWKTTAAVLWKIGGVMKAAFLNLGEQRPTPVQRDLGDTWPVWSTLVREGLLTVSPREAAVWTVAGPARRIPLSISEFATGAVVAWTAAARTRLLVGDGPYVVAFDLVTGEKLWRRDIGSGHGHKVLSLGLQDDRVIITSDGFVFVYDAFLGEAVTACPLRDTTIISSWISGPEALDVVYRQQEGSSRALRLARVTSVDALWRTSELRSTGEIRQVLWTGRQMVLVEPDGLRAYTLP